MSALAVWCIWNRIHHHRWLHKCWHFGSNLSCCCKKATWWLEFWSCYSYCYWLPWKGFPMDHFALLFVHFEGLDLFESWRECNHFYPKRRSCKLAIMGICFFSRNIMQSFFFFNSRAGDHVQWLHWEGVVVIWLLQP